MSLEEWLKWRKNGDWALGVASHISKRAKSCTRPVGNNLRRYRYQFIPHALPFGGIDYNPPPFGVIRPIQAVGLRPNVWPQTVIWGVWGVGILGQGILSICYVI